MPNKKLTKKKLIKMLSKDYKNREEPAEIGGYYFDGTKTIVLRKPRKILSI
jgi:hypothetical protein